MVCFRWVTHSVTFSPFQSFRIMFHLSLPPIVRTVFSLLRVEERHLSHHPPPCAPVLINQTLTIITSGPAVSSPFLQPWFTRLCSLLGDPLIAFSARKAAPTTTTETWRPSWPTWRRLRRSTSPKITSWSSPNPTAPSALKWGLFCEHWRWYGAALLCDFPVMLNISNPISALHFTHRSKSCSIHWTWSMKRWS